MFGGGVHIQQQMAQEIDTGHKFWHWLLEVFGPWTLLGFVIIGIYVVWVKKLRGLFK